MRQNLLLMLLAFNLFAESDTGCNVLVEQEPVGCSISNVLMNPAPIVEQEVKVVSKQTIPISEKLDFVEIDYEAQKLKIERVSTKEANACPPFCIEPMNIEDIKTVGELETLMFIDKLKEKKARLLIDVRESKAYQEGTIPGAINLPLSMLGDDSVYQKEVLVLLGAKQVAKTSKFKWTFQNAQWLLIFGGSASSNEASKTVKKLLELGYPSDKLLYYRSGISSWKALGLTTYSPK